MSNRLFNFNPGPAALPLEVLIQAQEEFVEYQNLGLSLMEMSHRSAAVEQLNEDTQKLFLQLLGLKKGYHVLFMGGGASTQFALVPLNFLPPYAAAEYILTGSFSEKAYSEAKFIGAARLTASSKNDKWSKIPSMNEVEIDRASAYLHITTNNTIEGSRYNELPTTGDVPLIADMTSDLLSRKLPFQRFAMIYAGAQKNLGPAGVTAVIIKEEMLQRASSSIPQILRYETFVKHQSLYNTPPVHSIYMMKLVLNWTQKQGGIDQLEQRNTEKARLLYDVIDASGGFYQGIINKEDRSHMNMTWRMASEEMEQRFIAESEQNGFEGLAGHRSVGGLRASSYNAVSLQACKALAEFMIEFQRMNG
ncbi:phosphoserine aminotransferase [Paenibacillus baekrokdamisoli]|uniref:Phosphoserine aminotransferase n=1 Tax=Paenibacillus baekrokdamisoli TaxID=1712516 RepID=A0A3G9J7Y6_9BACL|nr:3-phosphoserine/phosphohydroxythreonine transaminase [Paenibacillus baekrokdamisoli]MBB3071484.1 phosphoserine aminotransferase [Paenibacillus baekrokdamisoli]BBH24485.1 phosphoserine aminotransferase [Paenibacillus baekrokdamisoli]